MSRAPWLGRRYSLPPGGDSVPAPRSLGAGTPCRWEGMVSPRPVDWEAVLPAAGRGWYPRPVAWEAVLPRPCRREGMVCPRPVPWEAVVPAIGRGWCSLAPLLGRRYSLTSGGVGVSVHRCLGGGTMSSGGLVSRAPCRDYRYPLPLLGRRYCMPINGNVEMLAGLPQAWDRKEHRHKFTIVMRVRRWSMLSPLAP